MSLKKLGRYDLIRVLGKGAMGLVYEGRDPNLDRRVAIKTIKVENLSDEAAAEYEVRFRTEARSAARLQHPNIVSVYDSDRDSDVAYLVMEFIQGDDLKHHLDKGEVYNLQQTLGIMDDLLSALDYAHRQNIVHRDIKPANLLIEADGRVKLTDFGVARIQDSGEATRTQGTIVGTLKYMSPEQVQGRPVDARADIFAAGIVLYQLLTGKRPFDGDTDFSIIQQIVNTMPVAPTVYNPGLPPAMDVVLAKSLAKARELRYSTAQEFASALRAASRDAADPTVLPPAAAAVRGPTGTWTATVRADEALVGLQSATNATNATSPSNSTVTQELELVYWKDVKDSDDAEDLHVFLAKFPQGVYADLARRRLKKLSRLGTDDTDTRTLVAPQTDPQSGTHFDKTELLPKGASPLAAPAASTTDAAWKALEQAASAAPVVAPAQPAAHDPDATRLDAAVASSPDAAPVSVKPAAPAPVPVSKKPPAPAPARKKTEPAPKPAQPARSTKPAKASASSRGVVGWAIAGVAVLVVAGFGSRFMSGSDAPAAVVPALAVASAPAPVVAAASAPLAVPAAVPLAAPVASAPVVVAAAPAASAPSAKLAAASAPKKAASDKDKLQKPLPAKAASVPAGSAAKPNEGSAATSSSAAATATPSPKAEAGNPGQACENRLLIGFQICMAEQCAKPAFAQHPLCVQRREMEQKRRESEQLRN